MQIAYSKSKAATELLLSRYKKKFMSNFWLKIN